MLLLFKPPWTSASTTTTTRRPPPALLCLRRRRLFLPRQQRRLLRLLCFLPRQRASLPHLRALVQRKRTFGADSRVGSAERRTNLQNNDDAATCAADDVHYKVRCWGAKGALERRALGRRHMQGGRGEGRAGRGDRSQESVSWARMRGRARPVWTGRRLPRTSCPRADWARTPGPCARRVHAPALMLVPELALVAAVPETPQVGGADGGAPRAVPADAASGRGRGRGPAAASKRAHAARGPALVSRRAPPRAQATPRARPRRARPRVRA